MGEAAFHRGEHTNWLPNPKWPKLQTKQIILRNMYICTYVFAIIISFKRHDLKDRRASVWKGLEEEGEREMSKLNSNFKFFNLLNN